MKRLFILLCMVLAFSFLVIGTPNVIEHTGNISINATSLIVNATFLRDGESETLNVTLVMNSKGNWILGAMVNSTGNITPVYSDKVNITVYGSTHIIPLCTQRVPSDPFCNNHTTYNSSILRDGQSEDYIVDVLIDGSIPMPSNWTLSAFVNMSSNSTEVTSNSIIIEVVENIVGNVNVIINKPTNATYTNKTILFDIDSTGLTLGSCWYNNGLGNISYVCNSTFQLDLSEGDYHLFAYANQSDGLESSANVSYNVNSYPLLNLNKPNNNLYSKGTTLDFNWTVKDSSNASFSCDLYLDNDINFTISCLNNTLCNAQVTKIPDATYNWKVNCTDGVYSNMSVTRNFTIDTINPIITLVSPLNASYNAGLTTSVYTNEVSSCLVSIDENANISLNTTNNINFTDTLSYADGSHRLVFSCNDSASNWGFNNVTFFIDSTYPVWSANVTGFASGKSYNLNQIYGFNITFIDNIELANVSFVWNGVNRNMEEYSNIVSAIVAENFTTLGANNHTYYWVGCDRLGNCNTTDTWTYLIQKENTTSYAYIDSLRANKTYIYSTSEHTIIANGTTNLTALLYFNGVSKSNGTDMVLGVSTYNVTVINEGDSNYTGSNETWWVNVNQASTTTYLYIDTLFANTTKIFGDSLNITFYNTNSTLKLYINGTVGLNNSANKFNNSLGAGYYNITAFSLNTSNFSSSSETLWLNVTKKNTSIIMTGDGIRSNIIKTAEDTVNFTVTLVDANSSVLSFNVEWWNNFTGTWSKHNTSASPLYNLTNLSGYSTGIYLFGGRWDGNANYTSSVENWTMEVTDFNLTVNFSCGISEFTYNTTSGWVYNQTINMTNGTGGDTGLNQFRQVNLWDVRVTNATSGLRVSNGNWTVSGRFIKAYENVSYQNKLVNVTYYYVYKSIVNNVQKRIEPRYQNDSCGIFNLTLNTLGTTSNGTLKAKVIGVYVPNATIRLSMNNSNYSLTYILNNNTYVSLWNMTRGLSIMSWHWLDLNGTKWGTNLTHTIDFHIFTEGS